MSRIVSFLLIALLLVAPAAALAQEELTQTFTSDDGSLTFKYPEGWVVQGFFSFAVIANSQAALDASSDSLTSGQVQLTIIAQSLDDPDVDLPVNIDPANGITAMQVVEAALAESTTEEIEIVEKAAALKGVEVDAAITTVKQGNSEIVLIVLVPDQNTIIIFGASTIPGESGQYRDLLTAMANTISFVAPEPGSSGVESVAPAPVSGTLLWQTQRPNEFSSTGDTFGSLGNMAVGADDTIYITDGFSGVRVLDADGNVSALISNPEISNFDDAAVAADGSLWVADSFANKVYQINTSGEILNSFGEPGTEPGQFGEFSPEQIEVGPDGNLYAFNSRTVNDTSVGSIAVFGADGSLVREFPTDPDNAGVLGSFIQMAIGPDGNIYTADFFGALTVFSPEGEVVAKEFGKDALDFESATTLAVGSDGSVYFGSFGKVLKLDSAGTLVAQFGTEQVQPTDGTPPPNSPPVNSTV